jgi:hypothetical protein
VRGRSTLALDVQMGSVRHLLQWFDGLLAVALVLLGSWITYDSLQMAARADRMHHFEDGSEMAIFGVVFYIAPEALLFGLAALLIRHRSRAGWVIQAAAFIWIPAILAAGRLGIFR